MSRDALTFPLHHREALEPHLPPTDLSSPSPYPFTTLTFAQSLDSQLSLSPGVQTALSGPESKAMTHYLRSRHDAILIGVGTAVADNPSLNCRLGGVGGYGGVGLEGQPRPVVIDPHGRWLFTAESKIFKLCKEGRGKAPWVVTWILEEVWEVFEERARLLESVGGKFINLPSEKTGSGHMRIDWKRILRKLGYEGIKSVMIEGGAGVINSLLVPEYSPLISSVIVTIAPTWLGQGGVVVCPPRRNDDEEKAMPAVRLEGARWVPLGEDVVLCGKIRA